MLSCSVSTSPPPWYGPPRPWAPAQRPTLRLCQATSLPYLPLFPHLVKFLANTVQINTACKVYDSINHHLHQSTRTTGPQGGRGQTMTMLRGEGEERPWSIDTCIYVVGSSSNGKKPHTSAKRITPQLQTSTMGGKYLHYTKTHLFHELFVSNLQIFNVKWQFSLCSL